MTAAGLEPRVTRSSSGRTVSYELPLPYQRPPLSLNDGLGGKRGRHAKAAKVRALRDAVTVRGRQLDMRPAPHLHVVLHYVPRDRRARDADNLVATLKPCIDALTAAGATRGWACLSLVPDDTPEHLSWAPPTIHAPDEHGPRLWLQVIALPGPPAPAIRMED